jgi:DNA helicase-2/ATP-dependent DNA helicase PcrA
MNNDKKRLKLIYKIYQKLSFKNLEELKKLSEEQVNYINHSINFSCYLEACPGSGKTEVVAIKGACEFLSWKHPFKGIALLSFTKSAALELLNRIEKYVGINHNIHPHFIGTFDSWLHNYLVQPYGYKVMGYNGDEGNRSIRIIENKSRAGFLINYISYYWDNGEKKSIWVNEYSLNPRNGEIYLLNISKEKINDQLRKELIENKLKFFKAGFATYQDAEFIARKVLIENPQIANLSAKRFPNILIDECQDLSYGQLSILKILLDNGSSLQFIGDLNQAIYEFRKVDPKLVLKFIEQTKFSKKVLSNNYRSNQAIVDLCSKLINHDKQIVGCEKTRTKHQCILWEYTDENVEELSYHFVEKLREEKLDVKKSAILARGKATIKKVHPQEENTINSVELFANALNNWYGTNKSYHDINTAIVQIGKSLSNLAYDSKCNHTKHYCPEKLNPILWRLFLLKILKKSSSLYPFYDKNSQPYSWSIWCKELKKILESNWYSFIGNITEWDKVKSKIISPSGKKDKKINEMLFVPKRLTKMRATTIHSVKGETLDAVLLISSHDKKSQGGHFNHWLNPGEEDEYPRIAYVACSRPKHLLIIATPKLKDSELKQLTKLGLQKQQYGQIDIFS